MPLSEPVSRSIDHRRDIECCGYARDDGLWDIEGHLTDTKAYVFQSRERGEVKPGEPVHDMWIRLTIDDLMKIHHAEAAVDYSPFRVCAGATAKLREIEGLSIGPGWMREVTKVMGGAKGCTHLVELLRPMATTAFQTLVREGRTAKLFGGERPRFLNSCHALRTDGEVVKLDWPEFYEGN